MRKSTKLTRVNRLGTKGLLKNGQEGGLSVMRFDGNGGEAAELEIKGSAGRNKEKNGGIWGRRAENEKRGGGMDIAKRRGRN